MTEPMTDERLKQLRRLFGRAVFDDRPWVQSAGHELIAEVERLRKASVKRQLINDAFRGTHRKRKD